MYTSEHMQGRFNSLTFNCNWIYDVRYGLREQIIQVAEYRRDIRLRRSLWCRTCFVWLLWLHICSPKYQTGIILETHCSLLSRVVLCGAKYRLKSRAAKEGDKVALIGAQGTMSEFLAPWVKASQLLLYKCIVGKQN